MSIFSTQHPAPSTQHPAPSTQHPAPSTQRLHRAVLGILFALGMVVGCEEPATVTYTVTFNTNGGTAVAALKVKSGEQVKRPTQDPTKEDNAFLGWYADKGLTQHYDFATPVKKNITLYAGWKAQVLVVPTGLTITGADEVSIGGSTPLGIDPTPANADARVTWTIEDNDANNSKGRIDAAGYYTAPNARPNPATVTITATSTANTAIRNTHELTITLPVPTAITITAAADTVSIGGGTQLSIDPTPENTDTRVTWAIADNDDNSKGRIDAAGHYTAPNAIPTPSIVTIEAISKVASGVSNAHELTLISLPPTAIAITGVDTMNATQHTPLSITPTPANADARVTWTIEDNDDNSKGTIDTTGLYTAPNTIPTPATVTIEATSKVASGVSNTTHAITITSNIPDANFRAALKGLIPDAFTGDWLDTAHAAVTGLTALDVNRDLTFDDEKISNLRGIEYFTSLTKLDCSYNYVTALDVSANTSLTRLLCVSNQLTALDVSHNTALDTLNCSYNQLTRLDASANTSLVVLDFTKNQLTELDVSDNTSLRSLGCAENQLTALDVSHNTSLTQLICFTNQLTALDVSHNTSLTLLICYGNQLTDLDMTGMRRAARLNIDAGVRGKNLITTLKAHDNIKNNDELKEAKTNRGDDIKIMTYTFDAGSMAYTLSCANYDPNDGDGKCIIEPTSFTVAATRNADSVSTSGTLQFSITDIQPTDADTRVTWSIAGNDANNSKGSIDANGLYTAPATIPSPATVTITATSAVATAISKTLEITVVQ